MGKMFVLLMMLGLIYVGIEIYTEGVDQAFGGTFAGWLDPIEPIGGDPQAIGITPAAQSGERGYSDARTRSGRVPLTQAVRERVTRDIERGADRYRDR